GLSVSDPSSYCNPPPPACPGTTLAQFFDAAGNLHIVLAQLDANDNSYGTTAVGWGGAGRQFSDLVGSDMAEVGTQNSGGTTLYDFKVDYISQKAGPPSGYASLGVTGGEGKLITGSLAGILEATTSFDKDLNNTGFFSGGAQVVGTGITNLLQNSPPTI